MRPGSPGIGNNSDLDVGSPGLFGFRGADRRKKVPPCPASATPRSSTNGTVPACSGDRALARIPFRAAEWVPGGLMRVRIVGSKQERYMASKRTGEPRLARLSVREVPVQYPSDSGVPDSENSRHSSALLSLRNALEHHFRNRPDVFVS